jgi:hypothetical protein
MQLPVELRGLGASSGRLVLDAGGIECSVAQLKALLPASLQDCILFYQVSDHRLAG